MISDETLDVNVDNLVSDIRFTKTDVCPQEKTIAINRVHACHALTKLYLMSYMDTSLFEGVISQDMSQLNVFPSGNMKLITETFLYACRII